MKAQAPPTFHPALLFESPLSLKYGTFCTIHSYIWLSVNLLSDAELIACVIKSAYDKLPQALRRDEFFFDELLVTVVGVDGGTARGKIENLLIFFLYIVKFRIYRAAEYSYTSYISQLHESLEICKGPSNET